jgi:hypothetical protein
MVQAVATGVTRDREPARGDPQRQASDRNVEIDLVLEILGKLDFFVNLFMLDLAVDVLDDHGVDAFGHADRPLGVAPGDVVLALLRVDHVEAAVQRILERFAAVGEVDRQADVGSSGGRGQDQDRGDDHENRESRHANSRAGAVSPGAGILQAIDRTSPARPGPSPCVARLPVFDSLCGSE